MQDDEFCIKFARVINDSPISQIIPLCEAFKRAFNLDRPTEDLAMSLVNSIRLAVAPENALQLIEIELLAAAQIKKDYFKQLQDLQEKRRKH